MEQQLEFEYAPHVPEIYWELEKMCLPLIESFHNDLEKHDKREISENPGVPFLHFTGSTGTYCFMFHPADWYPAPGEYVPYIFSTAERNHILRQTRICVETMHNLNRMALILYCDGEKLRKIQYEKAKELAVNYERKIQREWRLKGGE